LILYLEDIAAQKMYLILILIFAFAKMDVILSTEIITTIEEINMDATVETTTYSVLNEEINIEPSDIPEYELNVSDKRNKK
jgi:hypothetical protein